MATEQVNDILAWWAEQSFDGKHLFAMAENGDLILVAATPYKERKVATLAMENGETQLKNLIEKFDVLKAKLLELEVEWIAADDKLKMTDKVENFKEFAQHFNAVGDFSKIFAVITTWEAECKALIEENYKQKLHIVELAESMAESNQWKESALVLKELTDKWKSVGIVDKHRSDILYNRFEAAKKTFHDRKRVHQDDEERDLMHNLDLKIELAEEAEDLANSENWKATTEAFRTIIDRWKAIGRTLPKKNEELWQRINAAKTIFFERKAANYTKIQAEQEINYALKLSLVERAEALKNSTEWSSTAMAYATLMDEWKKSGRVPNDKADELWKRFVDAQEIFFEAKKKHTEATRSFLEANFIQKSAILKRAEELKNSSKWGDATAEMNKLMDEWKKLGPVPREHQNSIWEAFLAARKHFFNRKDTHREQRKVYVEAMKSARMEQAHNLVQKLLVEIEAEEEKLRDFDNAINNITPGKKAEELRKHLEALISDSTARLKRMKEKLEASKDELKAVEEKERQEQQVNVQETAAE